jgi:serine/threonine protein kinase
MAPEALRTRRFSEKSDVFGFGVTMWEIISGKRPWSGSDSIDVVVRVCNRERMKLPHCQDHRMLELIERCWKHSDYERPSMKQVLNLVDKSWRDSGGHLSSDPYGGLANLIKNGAAFQHDANVTENSMVEEGITPKRSFILTGDDKPQQDADGYVQFHA